MRVKYQIFLCLLFVLNSSYAQLSSGGFPLQVNSLKSSGEQVEKMPVLKENVIQAANKANKLNLMGLKPFKFAHAFEVALHAGNSGQWYSTNANYNVWKLKIESKNAKSLNLIFNNFRLAAGARLFIYNETENHYLGAYTVENNKISGKFAVAPILGDHLTVQYEVPEAMGTPVDFEISRVNHDFIGILKFDRRPLNGRVAGACNVDVNCELGDEWTQIKDAVCRLIVDGDEICSGTLINNTAENQKPYVLSASHCYDEWSLAETTVYTFNYESPYCAPLDGDPMHSLSGAIMKAQFDSLDFALAELDELPPPDFRPYYSGWDRTGDLPDSSASIHHPLGDIKKIAFDKDKAEYFTFKSSSIKNPENGSFQIQEWDAGVTEVGSSGGALFNMHHNLIGTLSGGAALCGNPVNDYFARFDMQWDFNPDSTKQLKHWLDPLNTGVNSLDGKNFNGDENLCKAFTNLENSDDHALVSLTVSEEFKGYWGGTNDVGISEIVERFYVPGDEVLDGISIGIGKVLLASQTSNSKITVKVYNGNALPETSIYSKVVEVRGLVEDAMNFIAFDEIVEPADTFFVGFELSHMEALDTFAIYQSLRKNSSSVNQYYYKQNSDWYNFQESNSQEYSMVNVMELVACNIDEITDTPIVNVPVNVLIYPNPTSSELEIESDNEIKPGSVSVYNMIGQQVEVRLLKVEKYHVRIKIAGNTPGVYFVRFNYDDKFVTRKISYIPQ